ncbi:glycine--tRNA ligase subunit beta [Primorskyibacter flagellatus]|uniref:Glycine--tRNA ligase beta subunit n=1 Tax=Primorskyibacter flagellatus TaxID=1387277 RepID=A0A1W2BHI9_9RHOB|nr:glycine--tRNA ligase subunit beta [Primorskyibacter flagellatus]SMC72142.1 glycyl-tRNA synthetase beta chain [Primorskyibacter flagellatus]
MPDLLIELFSEEIPARMQARAAEDLKTRVTEGLVEAGLTYAGAAGFATPRRLTLAVEGLTGRSPTLREERRGPRVDAPEKAVEGFLRGAGLTRDQLESREEKKGTFFFAVVEKPGRDANVIVAEVLEGVVRNFPWPKSMRWGDGSLRWVRPLHRILCILTTEAGAEVVPLEIDGIKAADVTEGHRFMAPGAFSVTSFEDYAAKLKRAKVILTPDERADHIWQEASNMAFASGLEVVEDRGLLAEVAGLVEWPVVLMGAIDEAFLGLPPEVLQTSMKEHQKFFSVRNAKTGRIEQFVTVANRETADQGATIFAGNRKVLSARLADAKFFWENDLRTVKREGMTAWTNRLADVTFHAKLGSQADRINRIGALAREIAPMVGADADLAEQAAKVAKADLSSEMVYEFPELQGLMGRYYSDAAGLPPEVGAACQEHYSPLGPSDDVPTAPVSVAVALADKLDTLIGFWAIDEKPTGSKDPYALRRAALGVIRLLLANELHASMDQIILDHITFIFVLRKGTVRPPNSSVKQAIISDLRELLSSEGKGEPVEPNLFQADLMKLQTTAADLLSFIHDRLKVHLRDEGIRHDAIDACLAMPGNDDLTLLVKRARALSDVLKTEDGANLVQGFKRANNLWRDEMKKAGVEDDELFLKAIQILEDAEENDGVEYSFGADVKFAESDEEKALFVALDVADARIKPAMAKEDFAEAMAAMADLRAPIDAFFEAVQVNDDNAVLRRNRLNLLSRIRQTCLAVADLTSIEG